MADPAYPNCVDAVVVIPGIMGSELVETASGRTLWGLADPGWYLSAWTTGSSLDTLHVTDDERSGRVGRVKATRLLRFPAVAPMLRGFEPYTALVTALRHTVLDPAAVLAFPYDWRLSVSVNAQRLAEAADDHLSRWRAHPRGSANARLVLVAHSMGGMVARYFTGLLGGDSEVRTTITLGTPFRGAVKAAQVLNSGRGAVVPLPPTRLRRLAATMPGLHDLLPSFRCVADGTDARRLNGSDVAALGGDAEMATDSAKMHDQIAAVGFAGLRAVVGVEQPTMQSLTMRDGVITAQQWTYLPGAETGLCETADRGGDETVSRESAAGGTQPAYFAQSHGALAAMPEVISHVRAVLTEDTLGPWLGQVPAIGLDIPDTAVAGEPFRISVTPAGDPSAVSCRVTDAATGTPVAHPQLALDSSGLNVNVRLREPGVYRVEAKGEAFSAVTQLLMVTPPTESDTE